MRPITTLPAGLLGALGLKVNGANPAVLNDQVAPTLDTWRFYMEASPNWATTTLTIPIGITPLTRDVTMTPPANVAWWIHGGELSWYVDPAGTAAVLLARLDRCLIANPALHECISDQDLYVTGVAATGIAREFTTPIRTGFMLLPGEAISPVYAADVVAVAAAGLRWSVRYTPFSL